MAMNGLYASLYGEKLVFAGGLMRYTVRPLLRCALSAAGRFFVFIFRNNRFVKASHANACWRH